MPTVQPVFIKSFQTNGDPDDRPAANQDGFEFDFSAVDAPQTHEDMPFNYEPIKRTQSDDHDDKWIDILTMSPPITQDGEDASYVVAWDLG